MEGLWRRKKRNWMTNRSQSCKDGGKSTASRRNSQCKDPNMGQRWVFSGKRRKTRRPGQCGVRSVRRMQAQITWGAVSPAQERVGILLQARWKSLEGLRKMTLSDVCVCVVFLFLFLRKILCRTYWRGQNLEAEDPIRWFLFLWEAMVVWTCGKVEMRRA